MEEIRIDKWLWTVRLTKSRSLATKCCKENKVKLNDKIAKPSTLVKVGDHIEFKRNGFNFSYVVKGILKSRVSATLAAPCYEDTTPLEEINKFKSWFIGKAAAERREKGEGRPTKRDRRTIENHKINYILFDDDYED